MSPPLPALLFLVLACRTPADTAPPVDTGPVDADGDGSPAWLDCDDGDPAVFPGAAESCNGVDDDCDEQIDEDTLTWFAADDDGDGWGDAEAGSWDCSLPSGHVEAGADADCDDADPTVHPAADESCNERDDDCDDEIDEGVLSTFLADSDGDGWGDDDSAVEACEAPSGHVEAEQGGDCDDGDAAVFPGAEESCNGVDDDCDGEVDDGVLLDFWADIDADGWGNPDYHSQACEAEVGMVDNDEDCDDGDPAVHPEAVEVCDGDDDDCDGEIDEGC